MRWRFFARRLVTLAASLAMASFVIFSATYLAPGSPVSALSGGQPLPAGGLRVLQQQYHLTAPFLTQYWCWLSNALHGNLGAIPAAVSRGIPGRPSIRPHILRNAAIPVAALAAAFGPLAAPHDPDLPDLSLSWVGPGGCGSIRTSCPAGSGSGWRSPAPWPWSASSPTS